MISAWLTAVLSAGCGRSDAPAAGKALVYCTPAAKPYAISFADTLSTVIGVEPTVAPLSSRDLLSALSSAPAGDYAVFLGQSFAADLQTRDLVRDTMVLKQLRPCVVSRVAVGLEDLAQPDMRLGSGRRSGPLGTTASRALPQRWREAIESNILHRSERSDELMRMVALGGLDAAFVWHSAEVPGGLRVLRLEAPEAQCPVMVAELRCSGLWRAQRQAVMAACLPADGTAVGRVGP